jgi:hypothetical protein
MMVPTTTTPATATRAMSMRGAMVMTTTREERMAFKTSHARHKLLPGIRWVVQVIDIGIHIECCFFVVVVVVVVVVIVVIEV